MQHRTANRRTSPRQCPTPTSASRTTGNGTIENTTAGNATTDNGTTEDALAAAAPAGADVTDTAPGAASPDAARPLLPVTNWQRLPNGSEVVRYDGPMFFSFTEHSLLSQYPHMRAECHWHVDFEFTHVIRGSMMYFVNGDIIRLSEGEGLFVNSRQLHYGFSDAGRDCEFACTLFNPLRLSLNEECSRQFIAPLMEHRALPYLTFTGERAEGRDALALLDRQLESRIRNDELMPLTTVSCFYALVRDMLILSDTVPAMRSGRHPHIAALTSMIDFVQRRYAEPVTLADIAQAGSVGRTTCTSIFRRYLGQTPIEFVTDVRMRTAARLLDSTPLPVSVIAERTGYSSASFFTHTFRRIMHVTPLQYRNRGATSGGTTSSSVPPDGMPSGDTPSATERSHP